MVNQQLVDYINQNKDNYSISALKKALINQGYSASDVEEATKVATGKAPPLLSPTPPPVATAPASDGEGLSADTAKILAALSYPIWIIALITIIIAKPKDKFARYHGFQGLFFGIGVVVVYIGFWIIESVLGMIPFLGFLVIILGFVVGLFFWVAVLGVEIVFALKAYKGQTFKVPLIYKFIPADVRYE